METVPSSWSPALLAFLGWTLLRTAAAEFMAFALFYAGYALADRFFRPERLSVRWSAAALFGLTISTLGFHAILWIGRFTLPAGLALSAVLLVAAGRLLPLSSFGRRFTADLADLTRGLRRWRDWRIALVAVFALAALLTGAKTLLIPPMGWDTLTYHGVKAALWVQQGGPISFDAPGGWSIYRLYFGGSEIIPAWVMLPFRSDVLVPFSDWVVCMALGLVAYALARTLGLPRWTAATQAFFLLSIPAIHRSAGLVYAEPVIALAMLGAVLFGTLYFRGGGAPALALSVALLGVMAGVKTVAIPLAAAGGAVLLVAAWRRGDLRRGPSILRLAVGVAVGAAAVVPWLIQNAAVCGHPLSPLSVRLFGITLGQSNPAMDWILSDATSAFQWANEWQVLRVLFGTDYINPRLGPLVIPVLLLLPAGLLALKGRDRWAAALLGILAFANLAIFYSSGMTMVRYTFARSTARFLVPLVVVAVVAAPLAFRRGKAQTVCGIVLAVMTLFQLEENLMWGTSGLVARLAPVIAVLLMLLGLGALGLAQEGRRKALAAVLGLIPLLVLPPLSVLKEETRAGMYNDRLLWMHHPFSRYWSWAVAMVDKPGESYRIAITAGPWQTADNWFAYPFFGSRLQNRLAYVPVTATGDAVDFRATKAYFDSGDREAWVRRLREQSFTHVMSFAPDSLELRWLWTDPAMFEVMAAGPTWGLFRILDAPAAAEKERGP